MTGTWLCVPRFFGPEAGWRAAGAVLWCRAVLEQCRAWKGAARIPFRGNSGSSYTSGFPSEAIRKVRPEVIKLTPGQVRAVVEVTTSQSEDAFGEGRGRVDNSTVALSQAIGGSKEGAGMEKSFPPPLLGKEQMAPPQVQSSTSVALELQDPLPRVMVEESSQAVPAPSLSLSSSLEALILSISEDVKKGFANSEVNQGEIRELCAVLERKIDGVMKRTQALEEAMGGMKEELAQHKGTRRKRHGRQKERDNNVVH
ncbi:hypothetical protein NDU88_000925 [Pleurodeles waltl]|uniref:Uncharacterized protein n=1 Tax=Pleurodeles waltl TaxID=8319 RepID=A0AAV7VXN8_PLEWA|nr:hypothetical protein NDU88_000925 [Pleurodeles waltl]